MMRNKEWECQGSYFISTRTTKATPNYPSPIFPLPYYYLWRRVDFPTAHFSAGGGSYLSGSLLKRFPAYRSANEWLINFPTIISTTIYRRKKGIGGRRVRGRKNPHWFLLEAAPAPTQPQFNLGGLSLVPYVATESDIIKAGMEVGGWLIFILESDKANFDALHFAHNSILHCYVIIRQKPPKKQQR